MQSADEIFEELLNALPDAIEGKLFGARSLKAANGKNAAFLWNDRMTFKLDEASAQQALKLPRAQVGKHIYAADREMKGWVSLGLEQNAHWRNYAERALRYVASK